MPLLHPDRLFPANAEVRGIARRIFSQICDLPILSPHGHTDPRWFAEDACFPDPTALFLLPDHYILRMLYSQGIAMETLRAGADPKKAPEVWRLFAAHYYLFRGTPTRLWLDYVFQELFGLDVRLSRETADLYWDRISEHLTTPEFRPRALYERFRIEVIATTDNALDNLGAHAAIRNSGWKGRVIPTFRPDAVVDPEFAGFRGNLETLGGMTGEDTSTWKGYLAALAARRRFFKQQGATATDHGHPTAGTVNLSRSEAELLFRRMTRTDEPTPADAELFRAQMLSEMARMSVEDGLVMQLHVGSLRNYNPVLLAKWGRDQGADIPTPTNYVHALHPLLARYGNERDFRLILFTLDESTYSRELAPLAGHYPSLILGPPWWFLDSPEGMMRFRQHVTETAGFYNTAGFNDDTRAFLSIPGRHDVARRTDAAYLATLVADHRLEEDEALEVARDLTGPLVRRAYKLNDPNTTDPS
ncbi:MAG TPA: glucuronate isomerase [Acidobacteriaceae bacterium]|jgi:glucuronate isomerase|nr:glucuronate isomerase [Acidobacteriaceae bacterium]